MWDGGDIPRGFSSKIRFMQDKSQTGAVVKTNSPISFGGWTFYQNSYSDGGKTGSTVLSRSSVLPDRIYRPGSGYIHRAYDPLYGFPVSGL